MIDRNKPYWIDRTCYVNGRPFYSVKRYNLAWSIHTPDGDFRGYRQTLEGAMRRAQEMAERDAKGA